MYNYNFLHTLLTMFYGVQTNFFGHLITFYHCRGRLPKDAF